ncbi:hypothetical protein A2159_02675 [Candidatus Woesebacteria bacterium RBG_13_34_9]|uniref:Sodium/calcium exchanger membrane region domain-containing protein n=1 Tax=Candidatus Woesebacteria bacterium RBG_13_34_9 TaxID=1802477 RepID=A0A1F7X0G3_9BACT|nr:MAG: hypothetical protein A2159_02675 [Candidatus Woesebacteria bacterium RBG_13_34_9]
MVTFYIISIILLSLVLIKAADIVIISLRRIARESHTRVFVLSLVIAALGTSLPELFVGITSSLEGSSNLSLGVVIGSNISNIALIGALAAFVFGKVIIHEDFIKKEVWIAFASGLVPLFLIFDKEISRIDGLILIMLYLAYTTGFFRQRFEQIGREHHKDTFFHRFLREVKVIESIKAKEYGKMFVGIALLIASSDIIVKISQRFALEIHIPIFIIGLIILAVGTSLPELAFSFQTLKDHEPSMFLGNLLGSTIVNSTLILGISSIINPIKGIPVIDYSFAAIAFVLIFLLFWLFIRSKHRLERWEAGLLLTLYFLFLIVEFV